MKCSNDNKDKHWIFNVLQTVLSVPLISTNLIKERNSVKENVIFIVSQSFIFKFGIIEYNKVKRKHLWSSASQVTQRDKRSVMSKSDKGLTSRIHKEFLYINNKKLQ